MRHLGGTPGIKPELAVPQTAVLSLHYGPHVVGECTSVCTTPAALLLYICSKTRYLYKHLYNTRRAFAVHLPENLAFVQAFVQHTPCFCCTFARKPGICTSVCTTPAALLLYISGLGAGPRVELGWTGLWGPFGSRSSLLCWYSVTCNLGARHLPILVLGKGIEPLTSCL